MHNQLIGGGKKKAHKNSEKSEEEQKDEVKKDKKSPKPKVSEGPSRVPDNDVEEEYEGILESKDLEEGPGISEKDFNPENPLYSGRFESFTASMFSKMGAEDISKMYGTGKLCE